jgi:hypothetical protein
LDFGNPNYIFQLHLAKAMYPWVQWGSDGGLELIKNGPNEELQGPPLVMVLGFGKQQG